MDQFNLNPEDVTASVVGLGLMGCSITACLLMAGHPVIAIAPIPGDMITAKPRIREHLEKSLQEGITAKRPEELLARLTITEDYGKLKECTLVIECTLEDLEIKKKCVC